MSTTNSAGSGSEYRSLLGSAGPLSPFDGKDADGSGMNSGNRIGDDNDARSIDADVKSETTENTGDAIAISTDPVVNSTTPGDDKDATGTTAVDNKDATGNTATGNSYPNKLAVAGMFIVAGGGRDDGAAVIGSTAKKYAGVTKVGDEYKYGFYVAGVKDNASSDRFYRKFGAVEPGKEDVAKTLMNAIKHVIPATDKADVATGDPNADHATIQVLDNYLQYSPWGSMNVNAFRVAGRVLTAGLTNPSESNAPPAIKNYHAAIPNQGFKFWDLMNSTFQLYLEYEKNGDTVNGIGYLQFLGLKLRNEQFKIENNVIKLSKGVNVQIIKLIQDMMGSAGLRHETAVGTTTTTGGKSTRRKRKNSRKKGSSKKPVSHKKRKSGASKKRRSHPKKK
jgi:hypothetical protein